MLRPDPKKYKPTDFLRGVYEDDLDEYIDYLESKLLANYFNRSNIDVEKASDEIRQLLNKIREPHLYIDNEKFKATVSKLPFVELSPESLDDVCRTYNPEFDSFNDDDKHILRVMVNDLIQVLNKKGLCH